MPVADFLPGNGEGVPQSAQGQPILLVYVVEMQLSPCYILSEPIYAPGFLARMLLSDRSIVVFYCGQLSLVQ